MATTQQPLVVGVFDNRTLTERAVDELVNAGFDEDQVWFSGQGADTDSVLDKLKGLFTGKNAAEAETTDDFISLGIPEADARYYHQEYEAGRSIVTVKGGNRLQEATEILRRNGGHGAPTESTQTGFSGSTATTMTQGSVVQTAQPGYDSAGAQKIQLKEEQLLATKERVQAGEVGLHKEIVAEEKSLDVPVSREEVYIERHSVAGEVPSDTPIGTQDETFTVPIREERVTVTKQPVVREEIEVGKRVVQDTEPVKGTVRREKARVEREGDVPIHGTRTDPFHPGQTEVEDLLEDH